MAQCSSQPQYSCIGPGGSCSGIRTGCAHNKKDREDAERDQKATGNTSSGKMGFWGWAVIVVLALYFFTK